MKINKNIQVPNVAVYAALYIIVFGISIWLLSAHPDNPGNWFLYLAMVGLVLAGLAKFAFHRRKIPPRST